MLCLGKLLVKCVTKMCLITFFVIFMKKANAQQLKEVIRNVKRSHIFIITDSETQKEHAINVCRENKICPLKHIFSTESDKSPLYNKMYEILEVQITSLLGDLHSRASTRSVRHLTLELEELCGKLQSRKKKPKRSLTKQCIELIKEYVHFIPTTSYHIITFIIC